MIETAVETEIEQLAMVKATQRWLHAFESAVNTGDRPSPHFSVPTVGGVTSWPSPGRL